MAWKLAAAIWLATYVGAAAQELVPPALNAPEVIAARQDTMRQLEAMWLMLSDLTARPGALDRKAAAEGAEIMAGLLGDMQVQYPEGSFVPPTEAVAEVRRDWSDFLQLAATAQGHALALRDAALDDDKALAAKALAELEADCSTCHLRFSPGIRTDLRPWPGVR
ncbi:MAG: cytochrome c [Rhodospirillaceae bacterium]